MAIAFVQQKDQGDKVEAITTTRSVVFTSTPTEGNLLVAFVIGCHDELGLQVTSTGWTKITEVTFGGVFFLQLWYKIAGASESTTVTATTTNDARIAMWIAEYSGVDTDDPIDQYIQNYANGDAFCGAMPLPTSQKGLVLHCGATDDRNTGGQPSLLAFYGGDSEALRGARFSHRTGASDTQGCTGWVYEKIRTSGEQPPYGSFDFDSVTGSEQVGISVLFREDGAAAAGALTSGTGTGSFTQSKTAISTSSGSTISATLDADPTAGRLLVAAISWQDATTPGDDTITPPTGWTQAGSYQNNVKSTNLRSAIFYKIAVGGEDTGAITFTFSANNSRRSLVIAEYSTVLASPLEAGPNWLSGVYGESTSTDAEATSYYGSLGAAISSTDSIELAFTFCNDPAFINDGAAQDGWADRLALTNSTRGIALSDHFSAAGATARWRTVEGTTALTPSEALDVVILVFAVARVTDNDGWGWGDGQERWAA